MDYKPETPPSFSLAVEDFSQPEVRLRTPVPGEADDSDPDDGFCEIPAEDAVIAGRKRHRIFNSSLTKTMLTKTSWQPFQGRVVSPLFLLRRTRVWQPYPG